MKEDKVETDREEVWRKAKRRFVGVVKEKKTFDGSRCQVHHLDRLR